MIIKGTRFNNRIRHLLCIYGLFLLFFMGQKIIFLLYYFSYTAQNTFAECLLVLWHGLRMDITVAGYLTVLPLLVLLVSNFFNGKIFARILQVYFGAVALLASTIFVGDLMLYGYWNFKLDATVFTYITNPKGATASVPVWVTALGVAFALAWAVAQWWTFNRYVAKPLRQNERSSHCIVESIVLFLLLAPMGVGIRGGVTASTMNVGAVYFSRNMFLNHAAVNPNFSLLSSLQYSYNFGKQYRFMSDQEASAIFKNLTSCDKRDSTVCVFNNKRPNIIFVILESCGAQFVESLGGAKGVMPNLEKITNDGIFFTNMYANSFRTDRGITSCLSGFPAQPAMSILKYPKKCEALNSIPKSLISNGYNAQYIYGGDVDFAHVNTFFISQKVTNIISQKNLPREELQSAWGAYDHIMFRRLMQQIQNEKQEPYLKIFLTLSSHEPFIVPYQKFDNPWLNAVAYTDSCLGVFVDELKKTSQWDNTLLVLVPDHTTNYPDLARYEPKRHHIYMIWTGGAVKEAQTVERFCSQSDIATTLLHQLNMDCTPFIFSKDILNPYTPDFAFYAYPNGFGMVAPQGKISFDCDANRIVFEEGAETDTLVLQGKAFLQKLYDAIEDM
jgi:phosphoglycerol transferase MdoB-like AlkP superfamily enzyme